MPKINASWPAPPQEARIGAKSVLSGGKAMIPSLMVCKEVRKRFKECFALADLTTSRLEIH